MNKLFKITLFAAAVLVAGKSYAQTHDDDNLGHKIGKTATKVGHKTEELGSKGASAVIDKKYDNKRAPGGQTVYIDKHSRYYYVNKTGHHVFLKKSQLRDKPSD
jgi:hypothetical protein